MFWQLLLQIIFHNLRFFSFITLFLIYKTQEQHSLEQQTIFTPIFPETDPLLFSHFGQTNDYGLFLLAF